MGNTIYPRWSQKNSDGGFEDPFVAKLNEGIIKGQWEESEFLKDIAGYNKRILKLPQFVTYGDTRPIEMWIKHRPQVKLLMMVRDIKQVVASMDKYKMNPLGQSTEESEKLLDAYLNKFRAKIEELGVQHREIAHPSFVSEPESCIEIISDLSLIHI